MHFGNKNNQSIDSNEHPWWSSQTDGIVIVACYYQFYVKTTYILNSKFNSTIKLECQTKIWKTLTPKTWNLTSSISLDISSLSMPGQILFPIQFPSSKCSYILHLCKMYWSQGPAVLFHFTRLWRYPDQSFRHNHKPWPPKQLSPWCKLYMVYWCSPRQSGSTFIWLLQPGVPC